MSDEIEIKHVCGFCKKDLNTDEKVIPPTWYGRFQGSHILLALACPDCLQDDKNRDLWKNFGVK